MLKDPILQVKELAGSKDRDKNLKFFMSIFNIEEQVKKQKIVETTKEATEGILSSKPIFQS